MSSPVTSLVGLPELIKNCMVNVESSTQFDANYSVHGIRLNYTNYTPTAGTVPFTSHGWCSGYNDGNQYITCGSSCPIEYFAVSTQGRGDFDQWVTGYTIKYSYDGVKYLDYNGGAIISANSDRNTIVTHYFTKPFLARSVRLFAKTYNARASMRMELYGKPSNATAPPPPSPATPFFGKKVNIKNIVNDAYVRNNNGVIDLSASKKKLEEWTVEDAGGDKIRLLNTQFKKYLSSDATNYVSHATNANAVDIEWTISEIRPGVFTLSNQNGKLLKGTSSYDCEANDSNADPETEFEITIV